MKKLPELLLIFSACFSSCNLSNSPEMKALDRMNESPEKQAARAAIIVTTKESKHSAKNVLVMDILIDNKSDFSVKDFVIECNLFGSSKTELQRVKQTVFEELKPKERKTFKEINFGFANSQTDSFGCSLDNFNLAE